MRDGRQLTDAELATTTEAGAIVELPGRASCRYDVRGVDHVGGESLYFMWDLHRAEGMGDDGVAEFIVCAACIRRLIRTGLIPAV
jgi:hypothetical protein